MSEHGGQAGSPTKNSYEKQSFFQLITQLDSLSYAKYSYMFVHRGFVLQLYHKNLDAAFLASLFAAIATTQSHPTQTSAGRTRKEADRGAKRTTNPKP